MAEAVMGEYKCLARSRALAASAAFSESYSLWIGKDHLLLVSREAFTETYKRFFLKDIQAIVLRRTDSQKMFTVGIVGLIGFWALVLLAVAQDASNFTAAAVITGMEFVLVASLVWNFLLGPTCECYIHTAVQRTRLHPLGRLKQAMEVVRDIVGAVEGVQGAVPRENVEGAWIEMLRREDVIPVSAGTPPASAAASPAPDRAADAGIPKKFYSGWVHLILFPVLIIDFFDVVSEWFIKDGILGTGMAVLLFLLLVGTTVLALVRQHNTNAPREIRNLTWATLMYVFVGIIIMVAMPVIMLTSITTSSEDIDVMLSPTGSPTGMAINIFSMLCSGILGFWGLVETFRFRRRQQVPPDVAASPEGDGAAIRAIPDEIPPEGGTAVAAGKDDRKDDNGV